MKKISAILLVVAFSMLFVGAGCSHDSAEDVSELSNMKDVSFIPGDNSYSFSAQLPLDWEEDKVIYAPAVMYLSPVLEGDDFRENIIIARYGFIEEEVDMNIDDYFASATSGVENTAGYEPIFQENTTVSGFPAITHSYYYASDIGKLVFTQTVVKTDKEGYLFNYSASPKEVDKYMKVFKDFLNSIIIK